LAFNLLVLGPVNISQMK